MTNKPPALPPRILGKGEPVPWSKAQALSGSSHYAFDTVGGRHVVMLFLGSASLPQSAVALSEIERCRALFDDEQACFFGVTVDPADEAAGAIRQQIPGIRWFLDYDRRVSKLFGAALDEDRYFPHWLLLDPMLRVIERFPIGRGEDALAELRAALSSQQCGNWAPVLLAPNVIEPTLCRELIGLYQRSGGEESGFMREVEGKTVLVTDPAHKRRRDWLIDQPELQAKIRARIHARLAPMIKRSFQFEATRIERYLVGCYDAAGGGHFRPHRDNTTRGTAHRRFAVTINLNAEEYEGGDLRFPEFGSRTYRAPTGGGVVFSCSLLHEATPVTRGRRYAFLPFLYDEAARKIREANMAYVQSAN